MESKKRPHCEVCGGLHGIHPRAIPRSFNKESKGLLKQGGGDISNTHSKDFHSVTWYGRTYTFNENQAIVVKLLWKAMERGESGIHQNTIAESLGTYSKKYRLLDTFRQHKKKHPAWDEMIHHSGHGVYILNKPS